MVFGTSGLLSFDYGYQDMSNAELRPTSDPDFNSENQFISQQLGGVSTIRVGGEYRISQLSLRGGYRYEQSPFVNSSDWGDLQGYSGGLGFSFGPNRLDFTYSQTQQDIPQSLFDLGLSSAAVERINSFYTLTYTLNF
jgi:long-subunit fatty acid transport protein